MKIKILQSHLNVAGSDYKFRPTWFNFENCFENLLTTLDSDVELHVVYDITRGVADENWIKKYRSHIILHEISGGTMEAAALEMYRIAKDLSSHMADTDLFYFLENDYLHRNDWAYKVKELYSSFRGLTYISLYDHNDKYFAESYNNLVSKIITTNSHHWRTTPSTCGSYIVTKKIFLEDFDIHTNVMGDHNKWLYLNDTRNRHVLTPLPGLSTHCMEGLMSPTIDWEKINKNAL